MFSIQDIAGRLEEGLPGSKVKVEDLTGTSDHFQVTVVAEQFEGQNPVERHRLVYGALGPDVGGPIHALGIKAYTPTQWQSEKGKGKAFWEVKE